MSRQILPRHLRSQGVALIHDILMVPVAWFLAFWFRYNLGVLPVEYYRDALQGLMFVLPIQLTMFIIFGLYKGIWRFASLPDTCGFSRRCWSAPWSAWRCCSSSPGPAGCPVRCR
ncbi:MAG: hypothetical protein ABW068_08760 [Candidatus Thiodiazotropha sp.]